MHAPLAIERPRLLTDTVCDRIRAAIVDGEFALGEQMSEVQLAQRLGVSKTPVREALLRLRADGLVEIHPQRGSFVFRLDAAGVGQLCRYRAMIETAALTEALVEGRGAALAKRLRANVAAMRKAERARDLKALAALDMDFHWQFFAHCSNRYLLAGYDVVRWQLVAMRHRAPIDDAVDSHRGLVDAVAAGDAATACRLLTAHVIDNEPRYAAACATDERPAA